ncbi:major facilitator superfamily domain-containing protein 10 [Condylostylus longicornis]|uniref:major facilitator superfamily domain-containing protein 10 n=1 Tax=Condylostylus longicornis TaxID=2530218 RepID=UPI00244E40F9|nr:major facilitator superfamily domain-containing protein 10 [Condylostylus longicornis]
MKEVLGKENGLSFRGKENLSVIDGSQKKPCNSESTKEKINPMVYIVFCSLLLDLLAFTMILPLFPSILEFYKNNDNSGLYDSLSNSIKYFQIALNAPEKYNSVLFGGALGSMFSFLQFLVSPIVGALSDVFGRKKMMLLCALGIAFSYFIWAISHNFAIFVLARFVGGLSKGNISLSMAIITDVTNVSTRGKAMAFVGIAFSLGFILGPLIGAMFAMFMDKTTITWYWLPAIFAMSLAVLDVLFIGLFLKETLPENKRASHVVTSLTQAMDFVNVVSIFRFSAVKNIKKDDINFLKKMGFIYFFYLFIYSGLEFTVTFLMYHHFKYTSLDQARMFCTTGVIMAVLQGGVVRRLRPEKIKPSAVWGLYLIVPSFLCVGLAPTSFWLYFGMILFAISTAFVVTCLTTIVSQFGNHDQKGTVLGIFRSLGALARALGPFVGSIAFWGFGSTLTYVLGGILLLYPAVLLHKLKI